MIPTARQTVEATGDLAHLTSPRGTARKEVDSLFGLVLLFVVVDTAVAVSAALLFLLT